MKGNILTIDTVIKRISIILLILFVAGITSCNDEKSIDDFDIPILTEDNTIQFTVTSYTNGQNTSYVDLSVDGRFAVDWGDGTLEKKANLDSVAGSSHFYESSGDFKVKIWSEELTRLDVSSSSSKMSELIVGSCPVMKTLSIYNFKNTNSLDLTKCPILERLTIGNNSDLEHLNVSKCTQLKDLACYGNPQLSSIDLSKNKGLKTLYLLGDTLFSSIDLSNNKELEYVSLQVIGLTELNLKENTALKELHLSGNTQLSSIEWTRMQNLTHITLSNTKLTSFDAILFPALSYFVAINSKFNSLDFSTNINLEQLACPQNELENLIISEPSYIEELICSYNQLNKDILNNLFKRLPISKVSATKSSFPRPIPNRIIFNENPGADDCDVKIIRDKGWDIKESE